VVNDVDRSSKDTTVSDADSGSLEDDTLSNADATNEPSEGGQTDTDSDQSSPSLAITDSNSAENLRRSSASLDTPTNPDKDQSPPRSAESDDTQPNSANIEQSQTPENGSNKEYVSPLRSLLKGIGILTVAAVVVGWLLTSIAYLGPGDLGLDGSLGVIAVILLGGVFPLTAGFILLRALLNT
jgi:hypothetical protein